MKSKEPLPIFKFLFIIWVACNYLAFFEYMPWKIVSFINIVFWSSLLLMLVIGGTIVFGEGGEDDGSDND
jgi:hypothetical protein